MAIWPSGSVVFDFVDSSVVCNDFQGYNPNPRFFILLPKEGLLGLRVAGLLDL